MALSRLLRKFLFLSTLSLRRATTWTRGSRVTYVISIHALLAESDLKRFLLMCTIKHFYPRSPCGERLLFLISQHLINSISIHALLAESDRSARPETRQRDAISIHALLAESDNSMTHTPKCCEYFYPRSPCGERLEFRKLLYPGSTRISIHALLAESDPVRDIIQWEGMNFYPRSPCGERRKPRRLKSRRCVFLSTLSLRRATRTAIRITKQHCKFLSTLSLRRATIFTLLRDSAVKYFYPRSPCGERL